MRNLQILLRQHVGAPCAAIVKAGDEVKKGTLIATPTGLGANIFSSVYGVVEEVKEVDKALTEFKKVSDLRGSDLDDYSKDLAVSGREVARTMSDMIDAATMFRKSGFSDEEASQLAVVASMYQNIADTQVSAESAAASIVSQIRAFGEGVIEPMHIIDSYNAGSSENEDYYEQLVKLLEDLQKEEKQ